MGKRLKEKIKDEPSNKKKIIHICTAIIVVLVVILGSSSTLLYAIIKDRYNHAALNSDDLGINATNIDGDMKNKYINIALFGVDSRVNSFTVLSDSIMVLTLDYEHKTVKLSSFMRDSLVRIDTDWGTTYEKQTHAYSYGGAQLAVKTLNTNYDLDIQDYVTINWVGFETIINELGGLTIDVKSYELAEVNKYIRELNRVVGGEYVEELSFAGSQSLNGRQALSYSRIRKVGNGDEERTERQRSVVDQVISKLTKMSYGDIIALAYDFMPYVQTSFTMEDLIRNSGRLCHV